MNINFSNYIQQLQDLLSTGNAKEHSYRSAFQNLIESANQEITAINEPSYTGGNAPDFLFKKGDTPIAYAECKDIVVDIEHPEVQKQALRYVDAFGRILLTNYIDFEIIDTSGSVAKISIAKRDKDKITTIPENFETLENLLKDYLQPSHQTIKSAKKLAQIMASKARMLHDSARASLYENKNSDIYAQYQTFKDVLINELSEDDFADMYAQTIVYGLFVARYYDPTLKTFSRHEAQDLLPYTNPLLKKFFGHVAGTDYDPKISWLVDSLIESYLSADVAGIMHKEFEKKQKDPVLHFYETFLKEYDSKLRKNRGVYYTPEPVVSFIVRGIDQILKSKFNLSQGISDTSKISHQFKVGQTDGRTTDGVKIGKKDIHKVQILDPAIGTGTFLNEVIHEIYKSFKGQEGLWQSYSKEHLLPRLHGFELMMASYTMAHLKLGVTLQELGYKSDQRLSVWLTNSLEESVHEVPNLFMSQWLTEESNEASRIKSDMPIMVVLGNPPYSGESFNKNYSGHDVYKVESGGKQKLQERNSKWINDDYVKFIRFAENQISKSGEGVFGYITPHGFIDNPTFRGMRWHLMETFDEIYILDLHGNSNKKEVSPDGTKDENVFSIKTGTSIIFGIKLKNPKSKECKVFHADLYGKQADKFKKLEESSWKNYDWKEIKPQGKELFFIPFDYGVKEEYEKGFSISELFPVNTVGIVTSRDAFIIDTSKEVLETRIQDFLKIESEEAKSKYSLRENKSWKIKGAQQNTFHSELIQKISYRPFDNRYVYYDNNFIERSRQNIMQNFISGENIGLIFEKIVPSKKKGFSDVYLSKNIHDGHTIGSASYISPLYIYHEDGSKTSNLNKVILDEINKITEETQPEDMLDYVYAVLHSPKYREKYNKFLKIDFPYVPYPKSKENFWGLVSLGKEIRELHLLESKSLDKYITTYPENGSDTIDNKYPKYKDGNVYINEDQYFGGVPDTAWNFYIGGYQTAQKWLKDRQGQKLLTDDILHYQKIIVALAETDRVMKEIDLIF